MSGYRKQILQELQQLRRVEFNLQARFEALKTAGPEARSSFLDSLEEWRAQAQFLENLLCLPDRECVAG